MMIEVLLHNNNYICMTGLNCFLFFVVTKYSFANNASYKVFPTVHKVLIAKNCFALLLNVRICTEK